MPSTPPPCACSSRWPRRWAVALENVRLFNETQEALARQTATADVLQVISESPTDVQPVFDVIAERAALLTGRFALLVRLEGDTLHLASLHGSDPDTLAAARNCVATEAGRQHHRLPARAIREGRVVNVADAMNMPGADYDPRCGSRRAPAGTASSPCRWCHRAR